MELVFERGDPARAGAFLIYGSGRLPELGAPAEVVMALPDETGAIVARAVSVRRVPVGAMVPVLLGDQTGASPSVAFYGAIVRNALHLIARGRLLPGVSPGGVDAWRVGPYDVADVERVRALASAMPAAARAVPAAEGRLPDARELVRAVYDAVADTMPRTPGASWLTGDPRFADLGTSADHTQDAIDLGEWARQVAAGVDVGLRVALRLESRGDPARFTAVVRLRDLADPTRITDAEALWTGAETGFGERATFEAMVAVRRAAAVWSPLESLLADAEPTELDLVDADVADLLDGAETRLAEAGVAIEWPDEVSRDLGARIVVHAPGARPDNVAAHLRDSPPLPTRWQLLLAGIPLTDTETAAVASLRPIVALRGQSALVPPDLARKASEPNLPPLPAFAGFTAAVIGSAEIAGTLVETVADGWLGDVVALVTDAEGGPEPLVSPPGLKASLRDYQSRGVRWLHRMTTLGFGGCLADDMGLGKTITLIALHLARAATEPTLVVCPASLLGNWENEITRFAPGTPVRRFHGESRSLADVEGVVLTTYATMRVDAAALAGVRWGLVVADEAQNVKNRLSDTAKALRAIPAATRVALTGTPVENSLVDLWALLDWTTPGLLGTASAFRSTWGRAIEVDRDNRVAGRFGALVRPFVLRRRKSDPGIAAELPPKIETDHPVSLTDEQAVLYQRVVDEVMAEIRASETPIARRGLVLKLLVALKQVCNHPAHYLRETGTPARSRSEKLQLLDELVSTIAAEGGAVLVFTQYVRLARLLELHFAAMSVPTLLLHGGTPVRAREEMVRRFQAGDAPVFLLSLKAAGTGLTLTRADHVVHFDRWWNPAVEAQATDRAHRIGQTKSVQVHRFTTAGTLEERVATLLESKKELADAVLGGGEAALSELSDAELLRLVSLGSTQ
ncbi:SNF2 helicase protein [Actinokineospora cianjurensis]|uniref:SNF2 helicase protein n=2 Tax=Actinokineospora cianjurensis TaxID=585224 RepID=A0A421B3G1_9PSEU|nr:DEAD/DEAH box helicase [Actinokineospora cianjurensis]RLK58966.1 SNF2 helicase protein [Actinokineospora cianjurensis]